MADRYDALKAEDAKPAYAGMTDAARVAAINAPGPSVPGTVAPAALLKWGAKTGVRKAIEGAIADATIGGICLIVRDMLTTGTVGLDVSDPEIAGAGGMLDALVAKAVMTAAQKADLVALGSTPGPSIANGLGFPSINANDLIAARKR
jgi:hypothetical protein